MTFILDAQEIAQACAEYVGRKYGAIGAYKCSITATQSSDGKEQKIEAAVNITPKE